VSHQGYLLTCVSGICVRLAPPMYISPRKEPPCSQWDMISQHQRRETQRVGGKYDLLLGEKSVDDRDELGGFSLEADLFLTNDLRD